MQLQNFKPFYNLQQAKTYLVVRGGATKESYE